MTDTPEQIKAKLREMADKGLLPIKEATEEDRVKHYAKENSKNPELLKLIHSELDKDHLSDHREKIAVFISCCSAYLLNPEDRKSIALKGNSSSGKDNAINAALKHFPEEDWIKLTSATKATMEDDISKYRIIAFSEMNQHRENGANADIVESIKQMAEGGVHALKKDALTGFKTTKHSEQEQKSVLYGTTEAETDQELDTRFTIVGIKSDENKNKAVVCAYLKSISDIDCVIDKQKLSWIRKLISEYNTQFEVIIPFASILETFFDYKKDRIKRDVKRICCFAKAICWIHQRQRKVIQKNDKSFLIAEPSDLLNAINIFEPFFNLTYEGLDHREQQLLEYIREHEGKHSGEILNLGYDMQYSNWVLRHVAQEELGIEDRKTIKKYSDALNNKSKIDCVYLPTIPKGYLMRGREQGGNRQGLGGSLPAIDALMTAWLTPLNIQKWYTNKEIKPFLLDFTAFFKKFPPSKLTPSISEQILSFIKAKKTDIQEIISLFPEDRQRQAEATIKDMLTKGDIFEFKPGRVKLL